MSPDDEDDALLATAELLDTRSANFDPTTRRPRQALRWHTAGRMSCARDGFACGELPDGRVVRGAGPTISSPTPPACLHSSCSSWHECGSAHRTMKIATYL
eukprot:COSAG01_NODE_5378_length_4297_cov_3.601953_3_plen_101_part_00